MMSVKQRVLAVIAGLAMGMAIVAGMLALVCWIV